MTHTPTPHVWIPETRVAFLDSLAVSGMVRHACAAVGMSREAAYKLRNRRDGLAFRLGWDAALLIARTAIADDLMERAIDGQEDVIAWDEDRRTRTRRRHDNRLSLSLLGRLDRFAEAEHDLHRPAQVIARDWGAFLDLVTRGADDASVLAFATPPRDGLEPCQPDRQLTAAELERNLSVCWDDHDGEWRTSFPPPPGFDVDENGRFGDYDYDRACTEDEEDAEEARRDGTGTGLYAAAEALRCAYFGFVAAGESETASTCLHPVTVSLE